MGKRYTYWTGRRRTLPSTFTDPTQEESQQGYPTSQFGDTIPVVYGKCRLPSSYIWTTGVVTQVIKVPFLPDIIRLLLSARLRFASPMTVDSRWQVRRMWADGKLIFDATTGLRAINFAVYDGHSSQGRDPVQEAALGTANTSAHRGYLDIVIYAYDIGFLADNPPFFEAEWIQESLNTTDVDTFDTLISGTPTLVAARDFDEHEFYTFSPSNGYIRRFSIGRLREVYASKLLMSLDRTYDNFDESSLRYVPQTGKLLMLAEPVSVNRYYLIECDPLTGNITAEADLPSGWDVGADPVVTTCHVYISGVSIYLRTGTLENLTIYRVKQTGIVGDRIERTYHSGTGWQGYSEIRCVTVGEVRTDDADIWICADDDLIKMIVNVNGQITGRTVFATLASDPVYAVYYDEDIIVWNSSAQVIRLDAETGSTLWTESVPYQINADPTLRGMGDPDSNRFDGVALVIENTVYNFTSLKTGLTVEVARSAGLAYRHIYDSVTKTLVTTDTSGAPIRTIFDFVGDGTQRDLTDMLEALMVRGGFEASELTFENIDDVIDGSVVDITSGVRDVAMSICDPYSIAMFERGEDIVFKRALVDDAFAVDATLQSRDLIDRAGAAIKAKRLNPEERVAKYGIEYRDPDELYHYKSQFGEIPAVPFAVATTDIGIKASVPLVIDSDTAKIVATKRVYRDATEKHEFEIGLRAKHLGIEPETIIQFTFANRVIVANVYETIVQPDFTINLKATEFLNRADVVIVGGPNDPHEPDPKGTPASRYVHLDIPLQAAAHDQASEGLVQYHVLASNGQAYWDGAILYRRTASTSYEAVSSQTEDGLIGIATTLLPDADNPYVTEFTRQITVSIVSGDADLLTSATYLEVMNGANKFAIGAPGRWEICHVIDITSNGDGTYLFEGIVRGRGSSEEFTGDHAIGDLVVWLSGDNVDYLAYGLTDLNDEFQFRAVGIGGDLSTTPTVEATVTGQAEVIPKPSQLDAVLDGADIDLSWIRSARYGVIWDDEGEFETPLGETLEQYVVRIKDGPGGTVVRTVTVDDAETYTYTAADQTTYSGGTFSAGDDFTFDVRQVSGAGVTCPAREATITL
jgi:hypothetical protein